jgi:hypothetical protein
MILLATDIFGETDYVREIVCNLEDCGHGCSIVSPYVSSYTFADEEEAYAFFIGQGGVASYVGKLRERLAGSVVPLTCVGFSAGAAGLWRALACPGSGLVETAILFYGSQIRDAAELQPRCPTLLVFPAEEPHFSVAYLIERLRGRPGISSTTVPWLHGYVNRLSRNFDREGYRRTLAWLGELLEQPGGARATDDVFRPLLSKD